MSAMSAAAADDLRSRYPQVFRQSFWQRWRLPVVAATTILYLCFAWWMFGVGTALSKASWHIAGIYLSDWVSYEVRPTVETDGDYLKVTYPRFSPLGDNPDPDWLKKDETTIARRSAEAAAGTAPAGAPATSTSSSAGSFMAPAAPATSAPSTSTQSSAGSFMAPARRPRPRRLPRRRAAPTASWLRQRRRPRPDPPPDLRRRRRQRPPSRPWRP